MSVDLVPEWTIGDLRLTSYPYGVDADSAVDIGEPEMVVESVSSQIADGDIERVVRHGNRSYVIPFYVMGATLGELADAEALLRAELRRTDLTLTHDPGDGFTPASVYEVQTAQLTPERDDQRESHLIRRFTLTLACLPFARSLNPSVTLALPAGITPSSSVIDTCSSATGWTQQPSGAAALLDSGSGAVYSPGVSYSSTRTLRRVGAVDFTARRYLRVEWLSSAGDPLLAVRHDSSAFSTGQRPAIVRPQAGGWLEATFDLEGVTSTKLDFIATYAPGRYGDFYIRHVESTNVPPAVTPRQTRRAVSVGGTERTPGSLAIKANVPPSEVLGMTIVHTAPDDGSAFPLRSWRVDGNTQTPAANMSGSTEALTPTGKVFDARVWASHITPGNYLLAVRVSSSGTGTFRIPWTVSTLDDATGQTYAQHVDSTAFEYGTINTYQWVPLAILPMPTVRVTDGHSVRITLAGHADNPSALIFDEAWAFRGGDGCALTVVNDVPDYLWLNSADLGDGVPTILAGDNADGTGARYPVGKVHSQGAHEFTPDTTYAFVATESQYPLVSFEHYHRWHSNAADEGGEVE